MLDDNRYYTHFHIASHYHGSLIGKKGAMRSRIERDTKTEIKIPRMGENKDIVVLGASPANIKAARRRINIIVMAARMKYRPTHFLSIPMNHPDVMRSFEKFKALVLKECSGRGLEESLFIRPQKLHLTLGVTCLMDNEERLHACKLLTEAKTSIILPLIKDYLPLKIRMKGLSYMNDDPKEIDVLYGRVQEDTAPPGLLQRVADSLVQYFAKAGFMDNNDYGRDNVKLHVTLLNSKYRGRQRDTGDDETQSRSARKSRETFDGSQILQKFSDYDFGVMELTDIHLSQRKTMGTDGYYKSTCIMSCSLSEQ
ncbi:activating signal cointegrator 1 complex subunit 1 isoform X2 [Epargyreus clarus]